MPGGLRIVFLTHCAQFSGAEIEMLRLIEAADGIDAVVLLAEEGPLVEALEAAGAQVEVLPLTYRARTMRRQDVRAGRRQALAAIDTARYCRRVHRRLVQLRPDVVSAVSLKAGAYGTPAARLAGIPSVWHLHDQIAAGPLARQAVLPMHMLIGTMPDAVVSPSRAPLITVGRLRMGIRTAVIPTPVPVPDRPLPLRDHVRRIGIVGRLTPWKGQHVFLRAFAKAFRHDDVNAVVVGSAVFGEDDYARSLCELAESLGIADRVEFRGFRRDVHTELARLDLLVHASVQTEPMGTVIFEAMGAGLPVVAANSGGPAEYIRDGRNGLLHEPDDVEDLARVLQRAVADSDLRARLAVAGRSTASKFAPDVIAQAWLRFYGDLLNGRRATAAPSFSFAS